jgi:TetR/AcrR family transcriptional regulator
MGRGRQGRGRADRVARVRKTGSDPHKTRERILARATAEFAARGFEGARVDAIARRCGLAKNMLYHYFGSKEGLFIAVLERMYETLRARQRDFAVRGSDPVQAMRQLVAHTFSALLEHSEAIALLNDENLHKGRHARRSKRIRALYDPLVDTIREVLERGAAQGIFRADIDPVTLYLSLSSLAYHYVSNQYTLKAAFGIDFTTKTRRKAWLAHITDMILTYCRSGAGTVVRRAKRGKRS